MEKLLLLFAVSLLFSCSDKKQEQIDKNINENAMGADIGYVKGKLEDPLIFKYKDVLKIYKDQIGDDPGTDLNDFIKSYKEFAETDKENDDIDNYWHNTGRYKMFESWKGLKPDDKVYSVYKYTYGIDNILKAGEKRQVTNYYIFDRNDVLITKISEDEYLDYKREFIKSPNFWLIIALVNQYGKPDSSIKTSPDTNNINIESKKETETAEPSSDEAQRIVDSLAAEFDKGN